MHITLLQAFLIGVVYYLGTVGTPWLTLLGSISFMYKPLVAGTIVGFIMGDPVQGCIIGAAINLPYIAFISAGGTVPVDPGLAGSLGTALALAANVQPAVATTVAIPLGLLGTLIWVLHMTVDVFFVHMADKAAAESDLKKICFLHIVPPQIFMFLICVVPVTLGAYFGVSYISPMIKALTGTPLHVLQVIGQILPAIGIAMNLRAISRPGTLLFFILGFILKTYTSLNVITIAIMAGIVAYFYTKLTEGNSSAGNSLAG
ncbi:PTS sugar transporter subunit IIC [Clostridium sp. KNHs216]|uniref:PTS mannose/fructose/sorbose/N-acetylgalactosamine transporter subunit IIC n=1 Tax=Eubacteriales TaxID=186802 RepID=UPI001150CA31|nr:PTS sugar transporter subunit IIC [Clostridium sp. KNHs216]TQI68824.1 PTS system mannose-specific IIC component [Clostridium sp. KNHs216]